MVRRLTAVLGILAVTGVGGPGAAEGDNQSQKTGAPSWTLWLDLEMPALVPPVVQWAIFDEDPVPGFTERLEGLDDLSEKQVAQTEDAAMKDAMRSSHLKAAWDLVFEKVPGNQVYLVTERPGTSHTHASTGPVGRKWIATKAVDIDGKPVCWWTFTGSNEERDAAIEKRGATVFQSAGRAARVLGKLADYEESRRKHPDRVNDSRLVPRQTSQRRRDYGF